jgi:adenylate cyclase class 2
MLEVELKAVVSDERQVEKALMKLEPEKVETVSYHDVYFDSGDGLLRSSGRELRIRKISNGHTKIVLTYKDEPFDVQTLSKPEYEVAVDIEDYENIKHIIQMLGYPVDIEFTKFCKHYYLTYNGEKVLATLVKIPELASCFIEAESLVETMEETADAMENLKNLLAVSGISQSDITNEYYTDLVRASRDSNECTRG